MRLRRASPRDESAATASLGAHRDASMLALSDIARHGADLPEAA